MTFYETWLKHMLRLGRYRPQATVPHSRSAQWPAQCTLCGARVSMSLGRLLAEQDQRGSGAARTACTHPAPRPRPRRVAPPPPPRRPVSPKASQWDIEERRSAALAAASYELAEPYPGVAQNRWLVRCLLCGAVVWVTIPSAVRPGRSRCAHPPHRTVRPSHAALQRAAVASKSFPPADRPGGHRMTKRST